MNFDVFISYAWTDDSHRAWARLLASYLRHIGFSVGIDADVDYGNDLDGFMRKIPESEHVLMIVDENYAERADNVPDSGVSIESHIIAKTLDSKPENWAAVMLVNNDSGRLPLCLGDENRKYFDFRSYPDKGDFPGAEQIDDLWRWLAGLSPDKEFEVSPATIRERMYRVERIEAMKSPGAWSYPQLAGRGIVFKYEEAPDNSITIGAGEYEFKLNVSGKSDNSVYVCAANGQAVGLICAPGSVTCAKDAAQFVQAGRYVCPRVNQGVIIQNKNGCVCEVAVGMIRARRTNPIPMDPYIILNYKIFVD